MGIGDATSIGIFYRLKFGDNSYRPTRTCCSYLAFSFQFFFWQDGGIMKHKKRKELLVTDTTLCLVMPPSSEYHLPALSLQIHFSPTHLIKSTWTENSIPTVNLLMCNVSFLYSMKLKNNYYLSTTRWMELKLFSYELGSLKRTTQEKHSVLCNFRQTSSFLHYDFCFLQMLVEFEMGTSHGKINTGKTLNYKMWFDINQIPQDETMLVSYAADRDWDQHDRKRSMFPLCIDAHYLTWQCLYSAFKNLSIALLQSIITLHFISKQFQKNKSLPNYGLSFRKCVIIVAYYSYPKPFKVEAAQIWYFFWCLLVLMLIHFEIDYYAPKSIGIITLSIVL